MIRQKAISLAKRSRPSPRAGLTLIEMLLYAGLFSILIVVLSETLVAMLEVRIESQANAAVNQDSRYLLSRLSYDIQRSTATTVPNALGGSGGVLTLTIGGVSNTYQLNGTNLTLTNSNGTNVLNSPESKISNLTFRRLGNTGGEESVQIIYTITSTAQRDSGPETRTFQTTMGRR